MTNASAASAMSMSGDTFANAMAISAESMNQAVDGDFACGSGYAIDTAIAFVCTEPNGAALLSG